MENAYAKYLRVFNHFDANGDGKICPLELRHCVESMGGVMTEDATLALVHVDSHGDGLLSLEDFVKIVEGAGEEEKADDLKAAFRMYEDGGAAGCITPKSLRRMLSKLGERRNVEDCTGMIASFDLNGDGVLNFDEFKTMMAS